MSGGHKKTRSRGPARPGRRNRSATAAGISKVAQRALYVIRPTSGGEFPLRLKIKGREASVLDDLRKAGAQGVTPLEYPPGTRLSAYVHRLRGEGIPIETLRERHGGRFPGWHARYILRAIVQKGGAA
ncbi:MAG: winged helix domain-containing protein [Alkalilacustris sp.]